MHLPGPQVGLTVLKVAAAVGRLFGYPVPDLAGCSGQAIGWMSDTVNSALGEEAAAVFDQAAENAGRLFADSSSVALESEPPRVPLQTHKIMRRSAQELREKLPTDWEQCIGLAKVSHCRATSSPSFAAKVHSITLGTFSPVLHDHRWRQSR